MEQTNRTILFEEINPEVENLLEIIGDVKGKESLEDEIIKRIEKELVIDSYEDALKKFKPEISLVIDTESCFESSYKVEKQEETIISLSNENSILGQLLLLIQRKKEKVCTVENLSSILSHIIIEKEYREFQELRRELFSASVKKKTEAEKVMEQFIQKYDNSLFLLLVFMKEAAVVMQNHADHSTGLILGDEEKMQLIPLAVAENVKKKPISCMVEQKHEYQKFINDKIEKLVDCGNINNPSLLKEILLMILEKENTVMEEFRQNYGRIKELYISVMKHFWNEAESSIQTMLGIYEFFLQYERQPLEKKNAKYRSLGESEKQSIVQMNPKLLIANCTAEHLQQENNRQRLRIFLETVNNKNFSDSTIWYAIVPNVEIAELDGKKVRERFFSSREREKKHTIDKNMAFILVNILSEYDIQSFISLEGNNQTGFQKLMKDGIDSFENAFSFLELEEHKEYIVPCFPNFLLMPDRYMYLEVIDENGRVQKVWLDGVRIEAAYVAAGLFAACQCPAYLGRFYESNIDTDVPGVAYSLTQNEHQYRTVTTMSREIFIEDDDLIENAIRRSRGVLFLPMRNSVIVSTDRMYSYKESMKDNIAMIQTLTYLRRVIAVETQDFKEQMIKEFFSNRPGSLKSRWSAKGKCVNAIIKDGEELICRIDSNKKTCTFIMEYMESSKQNTVKINE